jgi:glutaconate CoA-transferase subunit B
MPNTGEWREGRGLSVAVDSVTADEVMIVAAARALRDGAVCLDGELATTADSVVSVPEVFNYWLQAGRIDVGFLGAAQIDRFANINTIVIGADYPHPEVRLPGAGGAPEIAAFCREVIVIVGQSRRSFVERVDFVTSVGFGATPGDRRRLGLSGRGPVKVITDLGVLEPGPESCELTMTAVHEGVDPERAREATGWPLQLADEPGVTQPPTTGELTALRELVPPPSGDAGA